MTTTEADGYLGHWDSYTNVTDGKWLIGGQYSPRNDYIGNNEKIHIIYRVASTQKATYFQIKQGQ